jgi:hypothetical protein
MKKQAYMIATMIALLTVAGLTTARAQTNGSRELRANIPFEFSVGNKTMPAGEYTVSFANPASDLKVLQLRSRDGGAGVMVLTRSVIGKIQDSAKLVFNRYGDHYFFAQAWLPADNTGMQASKSRSEKQIARELAREKRTTETVVATTRR